jgi:hypothetical protein
MSPPCEANQYHLAHAERLLASHAHWTGTELLPPAPALERARRLWEAPFAVVSHGLGADPVFDYGNATALGLFEYDWEGFTRLPSRLSAGPIDQRERARILDQVRRAGYASGYRGVRISARGRRFLIQDALVWNLLDAAGDYAGQAACFSRWEVLGP